MNFNKTSFNKTILEMPKSMRKALAQGKQSDTFALTMALQGVAFRDVPGRKTSQITVAGQRYFIKQHFGVGWAEIFKNLLAFKRPVLGAMTEVKAIKKLVQIGIPTTPLVAYGQRGFNPASLQSFVITEDLGNIVSLEDIIKLWNTNPPTTAFRANLMIAIAKLAANLHRHGLCHRDFYLCHLVVKQEDLEKNNLNINSLNLYLIDLHRMLQAQPSDGSAVMKDMAALFFSGLECGLNQDDLALIRQEYLPQAEVFWGKVNARAQKLLAKFHSASFQSRLKADRARLDVDDP